MLVKAVVFLMLLGIFVSLFSALVYLFKDQGRGRRVAAALTWRIGLSFTLFILLMAAFYWEIVPPEGLALFRRH